MNKLSKELLNSSIQGDELCHHGILGMHWGVRRYQPYGEGGYVPKKEQKKVYRAVIRGNTNAIHKNKALSELYKNSEANKSLKKAQKARYDYERTNYDNKYSHLPYNERAKASSTKYDEWKSAQKESIEKNKQFAEDFLGKYANRKIWVQEGGLLGSHKKAKDILARALMGDYSYASS